MTTETVIPEALTGFTDPQPVALPGGRWVAWRVGPEFRGTRPLVMLPADWQERPHEVTPYLIPPKVIPRGSTGWAFTDPLRRLQLVWEDATRRQETTGARPGRSVEEFVLSEGVPVDTYLPLQPWVLEREIAISDEFDRMQVPAICEALGLVMDWTSKSHPLRQAGTPALVEAVSQVLPSRIRPDRTYRELRSLLKNGLPLQRPDPELGILGQVMTRLVVAAVPFGGERTDLVWVTPSGAEKLTATRRFDVTEADYEHSFRHVEHVHYERYLRREREAYRMPLWRYTPAVRGWFKMKPPHVKVVTAAGIKGMGVHCLPLRTVDGTEIDMVVDARSVESKEAWAWFVQEDENLWLGEIPAGVTDHGPHYHRRQAVSVRPELHILAQLPMDPVRQLQPELMQLKGLLGMAHDLGLAEVH